MKLLRLRVVALILVLFIIIMSSCAGERGILPVQVDGIGTDRQGEKIEDHLEDQQVHSNTGEVELIPREVLFADPVRTSPSISPDGTKLAYRLFEDGYDTILVKYLDQDRDDIPVQQPGTPGNYRFFWAGDNKHILILQDYLGMKTITCMHPILKRVG